MKVVFIVGLPGSGKTYYIKKNRRLFDAVLDDFVTPKNLEKALKKKPRRIFAADPEFCKEHTLNKALEMALCYTGDVDVIYFENDPEKAIKNSQDRKDKRVDNFIKLLSGIYKPPENSLKIYQKWFG